MDARNTPKEGKPYDLGANPAQRRRLNPEDNLAASGGNLAERLVSQAARNNRGLVLLLNELSGPIGFEKSDPLARSFFANPEPGAEFLFQVYINDLIVYEEYDVLIDAVSAYNSIFESRHQGNGGFESTLTLQLPANWSPPGGIQQMVDAISRIKVAVIVVLPPAGGTASAATSFCVGALLAAGSSELVVRCPMQRPEVVSQAIQNSQLKSITLGSSQFDSPIYALELESFRSLAQGLAHCPTLKHLCIEHQDLFPALHPIVASFAQPGGPTLTSADVQGDAWLDTSPREFLTNTMLLMHALRVHPLSKINLNIPIRSELDLELMFLIPFSGHRDLTTLAIGYDGPMHPSGETMGILPDMVRFLITCPQLTHLALAFAPTQDAGQAMVKLQRTGVDIVQSKRSLVMRSMMQSPAFKLKDVSITGLSVPSAVSIAFVEEIATNRTLNAVTLKWCGDLKTILALDRLRNHPTLGYLTLSSNFSDYFLFARNRLAYTFLSNQANDTDAYDDAKDLPTEFNLIHRVDATDDEKEAAAWTFDPMRSLANTFLPMLESIMADNRQQQALQVWQTQGLQQRAVAPPVLPAQGDRPTPLENPLQRVKLAALSDADKALYDNVLLALNEQVPTEILVAAIFPAAPLNVVDDRGANALIMKAVQLNRADFVLALRGRGAKDYGGHGAERASSSDVVNALK